MLEIPLQIRPDAEDADPKGRVLLFDTETGAWEAVALQDVAGMDQRRYTHWQSLPPAPVPPPASRLSPVVFEAYSPSGGIRLVNGVRATHRASGISVAYAKARSETANRERAEALLSNILGGLRHYESEIDLLETSLAQALALLILLSDALDSPFSKLITAEQRERLAPVTRDVARALPYFETQGIWEGVTELFGQLLEIAATDGQATLREVLLARLPEGSDALPTAGDTARQLLKLAAEGGLVQLIAGDQSAETDIVQVPSFDEPTSLAQLASSEDLHMAVLEDEIPGFDDGLDLSLMPGPEDEDMPAFDDPVEVVKRSREDKEGVTDEGGTSDGKQGGGYDSDTDFGFN